MMAERQAPAPTLLAMGEIAAGLARRQRQARAEFDGLFAEFASARRARPGSSALTEASRGDTMKIFATYNIKGGVGKTATAVNLAYLAARDGYRVLLWDLDPQGAASFLFRVRPRVKGGGKALIQGTRPVDDAIKGTDFDDLDLLPADFTYRNLDLRAGQRQEARPGGWPACWRRCGASTTWSSWTARRASRCCRRACCTPPTCCWCR